MKCTVFDIGGTEVKYSVLDETLQPQHAGAVPTPQEGQDALLAVMKRVYDEIGAGTDGIAVSMPGMIDADRGYVRTGGWLAYNAGTYFGEKLSALCGCPVRIDNDGKCAAWAEYTAGSLQGCRNAAVFLIGTGVGGGLILNGQLMRGKHFSAGEFSFLSVNADTWGQPFSLEGNACATTGFLEMMRAAKQLPPDAPLNGRIAFDWINSGDEAALAVLKKFSYGVALQIYNLQMLLDVERVAIGGGISRQKLLIDTINEQFTQVLEDMPELVHGLVSQTVEIVPCRFHNEANQVGAYEGFKARAEADR